MFTVGVHGGMKPFNVVMIIANYIFYCLIGVAGYALFFRGNSSDRPTTRHSRNWRRWIAAS